MRSTLGYLLTAALVHCAAGEPSATDLLNSPLVTLDDSAAEAARARVTLGMPRGVVLQQIGAPSLQFTPDIWVFSDFRSASLPRTERRDALVVVFANHRVSQIRLTDAKAVKAMMARQKEAAAGSAVVAAR